MLTDGELKGGCDMFCPSCGVSAGFGAGFCASCGARLPSVAGATPGSGTLPAITSALGSGQPASFGARLGAYLIDLALILIASFVVAVVLALFIVAGSDTATADNVDDSNNAFQLLSFAAGLAYFWVSAVTGGTLGMRMVGLRIRAEGGDVGLSAGSALLRTIVFYLGSLLLLLGWLWMLWDDSQQTWHDKASHSLVVRI